jgi:chromosomal replication initiator protein
LLSDQVLDLLKNEISPEEHKKFIASLRFDEKNSTSDNVVFLAQNKLLVKWIQTKYADKIAHIYESLTGQKPTVTVVHKTFTNNVKNNTQQSAPAKNKTTSTILNTSYTFENFVVGTSNQLAFGAAQSTAINPGQQYNPLFIYGGSGLGKTHLIQAIGNYAINQGATVIYTTSEQFLNDFLYNLRNHTMERFRQKYRQCDFLLIDDIQFLSKKEQTQEEFFHTFNELHRMHKQIVLTSDKPPKKIAGFEERLTTRFEWGLMADVQPPGLETKISIIKKKCELDNIYLDDEVINYIAAHMEDNIREIESAIIYLNAHANLLSKKITIDFASEVMKDLIKERTVNITLDDIIKIIARELNIKPSDIKSKKRAQPIVEARRIGIYLAKTLTPENKMKDLAEFFGLKDHTAVSHAMRKINELLQTDENFKVKVEELKSKITSTKTNKGESV